MTPEFIRAKHFTVAARTEVGLLVLHTMEVPCASGMARRVAQGFALGERVASAHYCVDPSNVVQCVREDDVAFHCKSNATGDVNRHSIGIEHAGYSEGPSATDWQDEHAAGMFDLSAELAAEVCRRWQIPIVHLTPAQLLAGQRGIIGHVDATVAYQVPGGHQDPGKDWPWDNWLSLVLARVPPASNS
jgi:N-acetyl-anhydromuramyl-L-alanine amidase AmpD